MAEDQLRVIEIDEDTLDTYFREQPDKIIAMMRQLGRRIQELTAEYEAVNAFIREKQEAGAEKQEGFLANLRKYREMHRMIRKNAGATEEEVLIQRAFSAQGKDSARVLSFHRGQIIFREGDEGGYMYAVCGGSVGIYANYGTVNEKRLTTLSPDSFFGEMGLIMNEKRTATAVVEENDTLLECIGADDLQALLKEDTVKIYMIISHLSHRLRLLTRDYCKACAVAASEA